MEVKGKGRLVVQVYTSRAKLPVWVLPRKL